MSVFKTMLIAALFTVVKKRSQPACPSTDEWTEKFGLCMFVCLCVHLIKYYLALKKNAVTKFA